jgi:hypothetical protein
MVVPPLPIISFLTGSVNLLSSIQGAISLILQDKERVKSFDHQLEGFRLDLKSTQDLLEGWRKDWQLHETAPPELSHMYWGEGIFYMHLAIDTLNKSWHRMEEQFIEMHPEGFKNDSLWTDLAAQPGSEAASKQIIADFQTGLKQKRPWIAKVWTAIFIAPTFKENLQFLRQRAAELEKSSIDYFKLAQNMDRLSSDTAVADRRQSVQHKAYLLNLADRADPLATILLRRCENLNNYLADLYIDQALGSTPDTRIQCLAEKARTSTSSYRLRISSIETPSDSNLTVIIEEDPTWDKHQKHWDLENGLSQVMEKTPVKLLLERQVQPAELSNPDDAPGFVLKVQRSNFHKEVLKSETFASFIACPDESCPETTQAPKVLRDTEKFKLSCFLAECAVVFMRTAWLSTICSCMLQRVGLGLAYTFRLESTSTARQAESSAVSACQHKDVTHTGFLSKTGIVLAEIATGKKFDHTKSDRDQVCRDIDDLKWPGEVPQLYADAVHYCFSMESEDHGDPEGFYDGVVKP